MRLLVATLALTSTVASAELPLHLQGLPEGVVQRGPAPTALNSIGRGGRTALWLPGGERTFEVDQVVAGRQATTRFGRVEGVGQATITLGPDGGFGQVVQGHTVWLLEYRAGEAYAVRAGEGGLAIAPDDEAALTISPAIEAKAAAGGGGGGGPRTVDVAGIYDADFAARYPGTLAATRIESAVALANQAFVDSNVHISLRLVHTQVAPGAVAPSAYDNINAMYSALGGGTFGGVDLRKLRSSHHADLVSFFRVHDLYEREVCGIAFFPNSQKAGLSVVMDGASGGSVCLPKVFAHEIGHNFGARHQLASDANPAAEGHAFHRPGQFHTIMASLGSGKPDRFLTLNYFSNPRSACGNLPCGTAGSEDNAAVMNDNASYVAAYTPSPLLGQFQPVQPLAPTLADSDGDGAIDRVDAFPFDPARSVDRDGDGRADEDDAFPDNSTEWADTDGGGQGDNADTDDDNDGIADGSDKFPLDPLEWADADNDGTGDNADAFDADPREQRDTDGDGLGDRIADDDDDGDGIVDVAPFAAAADGELLVADAATHRILRFQGSDFAPLGTLLQLGESDVTFRSGMAGAPGGELYFVSRNHFHSLDRLRSATPELMFDPGADARVGTGFPLSPVVLSTGDVAIGEMGRGIYMVMRPAPWYARGARPMKIWPVFGVPSAPYLSAGDSGSLFVLDSGAGHNSNGELIWETYGPDPVAATFTTQLTASVTPVFATGDTAQRSNALLYWVDRRDGAVRSFVPTTGAAGSFVLPNADAAAIDVSPDGILVVAQRSGGVRAYDGNTGADLGLVIPVASAAQPLQLAWVPRIVDTDMPPIVPPAPPAPTADPATTPAFDSARPPPPPCTTACVIEFGSGEGSGGAFLAVVALLLALLARTARPIILRR